MIRALREVVLTMVFAVAFASAGAQTPPPNASPTDLFAVKCGTCHLPGGMGSVLLARRIGADRALLLERRDLDASYVRQVVRAGLGNMPRLTRAEVTDAELAAIVELLAETRTP